MTGPDGVREDGSRTRSVFVTKTVIAGEPAPNSRPRPPDFLISPPYRYNFAEICTVASVVTRRTLLRLTSAGIGGGTAGCVANRGHDPAGGEWTTETAMPIAKTYMGSGVIDRNLYCFGGIRAGPHRNATASGFVYDPAEGDGGSWSRIPDTPRPLWGQCGVSTGERLFSFGGAPRNSPYRTNDPPTDEIFVFEPGSEWENLTDTVGVRCPYETWGMQGVYNPRDGLIYNVGGARYRDNAYGDEFDWVWTFDPERERVVDAPRTRLPTKRRWSTVGIVEVKGAPLLHVIAGQSDRPERANDRYFLEADVWRTGAPAPAAGTFASNFDPVIDNTLYLTHGLIWTADEERSNDDYALACWAYDPVADEWETELADPRRKRSPGAADGVIDGRLYLAGGELTNYDIDRYKEATTHVESFTPD